MKMFFVFSFSICFLHFYNNSDHDIMVRDHNRRRCKDLNLKMIDNLEREREFLYFPQLIRGLTVDKKQQQQQQQQQQNFCSIIFFCNFRKIFLKCFI